MKHWHPGHSGSRGWGRLRGWAGAAVAVALLGGALGGGCAGRQKPEEADYSGQAKFAYDEAMDDYKSSDWLEALKKFNFVRTKFPYSKYAALATLRIADTYYEQEQWPDAVSGYRRFIQLHPTHPELPYAQYRIGLAFYEQLPGDWFFMPPAYERDLASTEDAERECRRFLEQFPNSSYAEEIAEKLKIVRQRLADHEFYVATFYLERSAPRAAAMRLSGLVERFPGLGFDQEALFLLGKSYILLSDVAKAVETWKRLIDQFPDHPLASEADTYMRRHNLMAALQTPATLPAAASGPSKAAPEAEAAPEVPAPLAEPLPEVEEGGLQLKLGGEGGGGLQLEGPDLPSSLEPEGGEDGGEGPDGDE